MNAIIRFLTIALAMAVFAAAQKCSSTSTGGGFAEGSVSWREVVSQSYAYKLGGLFGSSFDTNIGLNASYNVEDGVWDIAFSFSADGVSATRNFKEDEPVPSSLQLCANSSKATLCATFQNLKFTATEEEGGDFAWVACGSVPAITYKSGSTSNSCKLNPAPALISRTFKNHPNWQLTCDA